VFFEPIPVMQLSDEQEKPFENLIMQIVKIRKTNPNTDTLDLEKEIDEMIFRLYSFTEEEIKIVTDSQVH
jgi:hypothetical protein